MLGVAMRGTAMNTGSAYACFDAFGQPEDVLRLAPYAAGGQEAALKEGMLRVRMLAAPINPADINYIQGCYGEKPALPGARAGLEGCGVVVESRAAGVAPGEQVILLSGAGSWAEYLVAPADCFLRLERPLAPLQAAMLKVNPLTAYLVLTEFTSLQPGDWVVQNAANSGVGQCLIQLARLMGVRTVNFVRKAAEREDFLKGLGADVVVDEADPDAVALALDKTGGARPRLASNCVGGDSALRLMDMLATGGTMATFGSMSRQSIKVPNKWLIFKDISLRGLWCARWLQSAPRATVEAAYARLARYVAAGTLRQQVEAVYSLEDMRRAVLHAQQEGRKGKILLQTETCPTDTPFVTSSLS